MINEVLDVMVQLAKEGMTMMVVTHEMGFARKVADRVIFMDAGEIIENLPAQEFFGNPTPNAPRSSSRRFSSTDPTEPATRTASGTPDVRRRFASTERVAPRAALTVIIGVLPTPPFFQVSQ